MAQALHFIVYTVDIISRLPFAPPPVAMPAFNWRDNPTLAANDAHWARLSRWAKREADRDARREADRLDANYDRWLRGLAPLPPPTGHDDGSPFGCDCIGRRCSCKSQLGERCRKRRRW